MKTFDIKCSLRKEIGKKGSAKIRKEDGIVCTLYGGKENVNFYAPAPDFRHLIYTPDVHIVNLDIEGTVYKAIIKDIQVHPVTDKIIHLDFLEVIAGKPITLNIPLKVAGNSIGIKKGGKLSIAKRHMKVKGFAENMPQEVIVDITELDVNQTIKVGELKPENYEFVNNKREPVVSILASRLTAKTAEAAAPAKK